MARRGRDNGTAACDIRPYGAVASVREPAGMTLLVLQDLAWMAAFGGLVIGVMLGLRATQRRND